MKSTNNIRALKKLRESRLRIETLMDDGWLARNMPTIKIVSKGFILLLLFLFAWFAFFWSVEAGGEANHVMQSFPTNK